jgi:hypothetical protein
MNNTSNFCVAVTELGERHFTHHNQGTDNTKRHIYEIPVETLKGGDTWKNRMYTVSY